MKQADKLLSMIEKELGNEDNIPNASTKSTSSSIDDIRGNVDINFDLSASFERRDKAIQYMEKEKMEVKNLSLAESQAVENSVKNSINNEFYSLPELTSVFSNWEEPLLTNWNGSFKGTLDYIFVTDEWNVVKASVTPKVNIDSTADENYEDVESPTVSSPQPSATWSSDHLMVLSTLKL